MSQKTIAVLGATGVQGGSVVQALLKDGSWKIRGITRDTSKDAAKALEKQGVEVVSANIDDEASLAKAFEVSLPPMKHRTPSSGCKSLIATSHYLFSQVILSVCCGLLLRKMVMYERVLIFVATTREFRRSSPSQISGSTSSRVQMLSSHATKKSYKVCGLHSNSFPDKKAR